MPMNKLTPGATHRYMAHRRCPHGHTQTVVYDATPAEASEIAHEDTHHPDTVVEFYALGEGDPTVPTANPDTFVYTEAQAERYNVGYAATELNDDDITGPEDLALLGWLDAAAEKAGVDPSCYAAHLMEDPPGAPGLVDTLRSLFGDRLVVIDKPEDVAKLAGLFSGRAEEPPTLH